MNSRKSSGWSRPPSQGRAVGNGGEPATSHPRALGSLIACSFFGRSQFAAAMLLLMLPHASVGSQDQVDSPNDRPFEFEVGVAYHASRSWGQSVRSAMRAGQLNGSSCGNFGEIFCSGGGHPFGDDETIGFSVAAAYRFNAKVGVRVFYTPIPEGYVEGYYDGGRSTGQDAELSVEFPSGRALGLQFAYYPLRGIRLGAGPALFKAEVRTITGGVVSSGVIAHESRPTYAGAAFDVDITLPPRSPAYFYVGIQYQWSLPKDLGPFDAQNGVGEVLAVMPSVRASLTHAVVTLGLGFRGPS